MKFGQLIKLEQIIELAQNWGDIFLLFKNHKENEARKLVPDHFLLFKKALYVVKASSLQPSFSII